MIFAPPFHRVAEHVDRRVLGAVQFVDAVTQLPISIAANVEVRGATLENGAPPVAVPLGERSVQIRQNRSGIHAILRAPFFDEYAATFDAPQNPPGRLRLRLAVTDAGPHYLPLEFAVTLPRSLNHPDDASVFEPVRVGLFRAPGGPVLGGWSVLRVRVADNVSRGLPGVLVRVFRSPRAGGDRAIGQGMSEWRGGLRGEALVAVADLPRFRPGGGGNVFETEQAIVIEALRDPNFTGARGQFPDLTSILAGPSVTLIPPAAPNLRAGRETTASITMP